MLEQALRTILKTGSRLFCPSCATEVIVLRSPNRPVDVACGAEPLLIGAPEARGDAMTSPGPGHEHGTSVGKRYKHARTGLELLCIRGGAGTLSVDREGLEVSIPKKLPSTD